MSSVNFRSDFFVGNRERLRKLFSGTAPIVITAHGLLQRSGDTTFPFQQDSSFWYLTGIDEPDVVLVIDKAKDYLIIPKRSTINETFDGAISREDLSRVSGINTLLGYDDGWKLLSSRVKKVKHVATLSALPNYIAQVGFYANPARANLVQKLKEINPELELLDLKEHLSMMRVVKQPIEIEAIKRAISITTSSIKTTLNSKRRKNYSYEYEIEAALTQAFRSAGTEGHAFTPIVAAGKNACVIHHINNNSKLKQTDLVVVDVGAEVCHYAADITRTYSLSGKPSSRQKAIYQAVKDAQDFALRFLKPGVTLREYEKEAEQYMGEKLRELNLIKTISTEKVRKYLPHLHSHFLGLDAHDSGNYKAPLEPNMILTVEPGIYIPKEGIGIRIEDDIIITPDGNEVLSRSLPRSL